MFYRMLKLMEREIVATLDEQNPAKRTTPTEGRNHALPPPVFTKSDLPMHYDFKPFKYRDQLIAAQRRKKNAMKPADEQTSDADEAEETEETPEQDVTALTKVHFHNLGTTDPAPSAPVPSALEHEFHDSLIDQVKRVFFTLPEALETHC